MPTGLSQGKSQGVHKSLLVLSLVDAYGLSQGKSQGVHKYVLVLNLVDAYGLSHPRSSRMNCKIVSCPVLLAERMRDY